MDLEAIVSCLADDVCYHNMPTKPLHGRDAVRDYLAKAWIFQQVDWQMRHIAVTDNVVLTERVDTFVINGCAVTLPVMGAFEVTDGKIDAWRDYFDLASYRAQLDAAASNDS